MFSPAFDGFYREALAAGFARRGAAGRFEVVCTVPVVVDDDVERAAFRVRPQLALYMGGMDAREADLHHDVFVRTGHADLAARVQDLYRSGEKQAAAATIPTGRRSGSGATRPDGATP